MMGEDYKASIEHQSKLNLTMQEVMGKEVLNILDTGIVYTISDGHWIYPVEVVPKKEKSR